MKAVCNNDFVNALYSHEIKLFIDKYLRLKCFTTYWFRDLKSFYLHYYIYLHSNTFISLLICNISAFSIFNAVYFKLMKGML